MTNLDIRISCGSGRDPTWVNALTSDVPYSHLPGDNVLGDSSSGDLIMDSDRTVRKIGRASCRERGRSSEGERVGKEEGTVGLLGVDLRAEINTRNACRLGGKCH